MTSAESDLKAPMPNPLRDPFLLAIVALAAILLFSSLGRRCLWQDEAETALLARNILKFTVPVAYDGRNFVSQEAGREFGPHFLWQWSPWVQYYLASASMALLGQTTFAARFPFALLGFISIPLTFLLARKLFDDVLVARLSALFLALSVPFLLHARQARWLSLSYLLIVIILLYLMDLQRDDTLSRIGFVIAGVLLFYTNYFVAAGILLSVSITAYVINPRMQFFRRLLFLVLMIGVLSVPGIVFFGVLGKGTGGGMERFLAQFFAYLGSYFTFLVPMPLLVIVYFLKHEWRRTVGFLVAFSLVYVVYISLAPWMMFRYVSVLIPLAAILLALGATWIIRRNYLVGVITVLILVLTNILHLTPLGFLKTSGTQSADRYPSVGSISSPLVGYCYELLNDIDDPECVLSRYLKAHARAGDVVLITYGDLPLQFYTNLEVVGGLQGQPLREDPDWIIPRQFILSAEPGKDYSVAQFIRRNIDLSRYEQVPLPYRDFILGNDPDPAFHLFRMPDGAPPLIVLHKRIDLR